MRVQDLVLVGANGEPDHQQEAIDQAEGQPHQGARGCPEDEADQRTLDGKGKGPEHGSVEPGEGGTEEQLVEASPPKATPEQPGLVYVRVRHT
jgi:hypothetical protein